MIFHSYVKVYQRVGFVLPGQVWPKPGLERAVVPNVLSKEFPRGRLTMGHPNSWMVYNGKSDEHQNVALMIWGYSYYIGNPQLRKNCDRNNKVQGVTDKSSDSISECHWFANGNLMGGWVTAFTQRIQPLNQSNPWHQIRSDWTKCGKFPKTSLNMFGKKPWRCSAPELRKGCVFLKCHVGGLSVCRCICDPW